MSGVLETLSVNVVGEISDVTNAFNQLDQRVAGFGRSMQTMGSQLQGMGTSMSLAVTAPLMAIGGLGLKTAVDFDDAMRQVQAVTGSTGDSLDILRDAALRMGADTAFSSSQAAEAMLQLGQAGFSTDEILSSTEQVLSLASAGALDLGTAAGITANALMGFGLEADQTQRVVDLLAMGASISTTDVQGLGLALSYVAPVANAMGMSIEETTSLIAGLSNAGIEGERAGTALRGSIEALARPTTAAADIFARYGITLDQVNPATSSFTEILGVLSTAGVTASDVMGIFGVNAGPGVLALLGQGTPAIEAQTAALTESAGAAQTMADTMEGGAGGAIRQLQGSIETLQITIGDLIADALLPWIDRATELFNQLSSLPTPLLQNIIMIAGLAAAIGPALIAFGTLIKSTGTIITLFSGLPVLFGPIGLALAGIAAAAAIVYTNWDRVGPWLVQQFETLRGVTLALLERVQTLVRDGFEYISNWWSANGRAVLDALIAAFQRTVAFITPVYNAVRDLVLNAFTLISNWWTQNGSEVMEMLRAAFDRIQAAAIPLITTIRDLVERALVGISNWWTANGNTVLNALNTAFQWIITTGSQLIAVVLDLANRGLIAISNWWTANGNTVMTALNTAFTWLITTGSDLIDTVWDLATRGFTAISNWWSADGESTLNTLWQKFNDLYDAIEPLIPIVVEFVQDGLEKISAWWAANGQDTLDAIQNLTDKSEWLFDNVLIPAIETLQIILPPIIEQIESWWDTLGGALEFIVDLINGDWADAWENIKTSVTEAYNDISNTFGTGALEEVIGGVWDLIGLDTSTAWEDIKTDITEKWDGIKETLTDKDGTFRTSVVTFWKFIRGDIKTETDGIGTDADTSFAGLNTDISTRMEGIRTSISNSWTTIRQSVSESLTNIRTDASTAWDTIGSNASTASTNMQTEISAAWATIRTNISTSLTNIRTDVTDDWNNIRTSVSTSHSNIRTDAENAWNNIRTSIATSVANIRTDVTDDWNNIRTSVSTSHSNIRTDAENAWNNIRTSIATSVANIRTDVTNGWNDIVTAVTNAMNRVVTAVSSKWEEARTAVSNGVSTIVSTVSGFGTSLYNAGADLVQQVINGINSKITALKTKIREISNLSSAPSPTAPTSNPRTGGSSSGGTGRAVVRTAPSGDKVTSAPAPKDSNWRAETHDTGGIAGYTGWHWMEKDELAIPQATNWDAILINPISNALAKAASITAGRGIGAGAAQGNVNYEGDTFYITANLSSDYDFDKMMDDANRRTTRDRFRRGITS